MSSNAPGQLLGYTMQYPRALFHLLKSKEGDIVCVEIFGDVATFDGAGNVIAEEDKSSLNGNPVTDRSIDLWKTLSNWVDFAIEGTLLPLQTNFLLYRNQAGKSGLAELFSLAMTSEAADDAIEKAKTLLLDLPVEHLAYSYFKNAAIDNKHILKTIIQRFELVTGDGAGFDDVIHELRRFLIPDSQLDFVCHQLSGWLIRTLSERIANKEPAKVSWSEYKMQAKVLFDRARRMELIDFALNTPMSDGEIAHHMSLRPNYLLQLELIQSPDDEIFDAVTDYLRAKKNRDKWIQDEIIDEVVAQDFESRLAKYWKSTQTRIRIVHPSLTDEDKGRLLLSECQTRVELIRGATPPAATIAGTYHALANGSTLGWHPQWAEKMMKGTS